MIYGRRERWLAEVRRELDAVPEWPPLEMEDLGKRAYSGYQEWRITYRMTICCARWSGSLPRMGRP